jgi:soluble lytic murein transglycosylase-like protein
VRLRAGPASRAAAAFLALAILPFALRAETVVLRNGLRLNVTSYQLLGEKYRLQLSGGFVEVPAEEVAAIEPQILFVSEPPKAEPPAAAPYRELVEAAAAKYKIDADLISSVMAIESNFDPKAVSRRNARGLMQLMPETAMQFGVKDVFDPKENVDAGTHYLRDLLERYNNDLVLALAAYNAGPERVYGRVPPFRETRNYVVRVKRNYDQRKFEQHKTGESKAGTVRKDSSQADAARGTGTSNTKAARD